jgi:hypothetical protein
MLIRVFPRRTKATPDDDKVRFSEPNLFDVADEVRVSVTWVEDKQHGEYLAESWRSVTNNVSIGGPAYNDCGGEFEPGMYLKHGYTITSRGCPNKCWFCLVPKREGSIREIEIKDGYNVLDSNLLACSELHIKKVFEMLSRQKRRPCFTGGLEAARMSPWVAEYLKELNPKIAYFAYDTHDDYNPLVDAVKMLRDAGISFKSHNYRCFVLVGYKNDTMEKAERRLTQVINLGLMPMAMLYNKEMHREQNDGWVKFQRIWCRPHIIGLKLKLIER